MREDTNGAINEDSNLVSSSKRRSIHYENTQASTSKLKLKILKSIERTLNHKYQLNAESQSDLTLTHRREVVEPTQMSPDAKLLI